MLSLYDYKKKAAGKEEGRQVYTVAKQLRIRVGNKHVDNPKYRGAVLTYPNSFLNFYYNELPEIQYGQTVPVEIN